MMKPTPPIPLPPFPSLHNVAPPSRYAFLAAETKENFKAALEYDAKLKEIEQQNLDSQRNAGIERYKADLDNIETNRTNKKNEELRGKEILAQNAQTAMLDRRNHKIFIGVLVTAFVALIAAIIGSDGLISSIQSILPQSPDKSY